MKQEIQIQMGEGAMRSVIADVRGRGLWGVHRGVQLEGAIGTLKEDAWVVTHVPTGCFVWQGSSRVDALKVRARCMAVPGCEGITVRVVEKCESAPWKLEIVWSDEVRLALLAAVGR